MFLILLLLHWEFIYFSSHRITQDIKFLHITWKLQASHTDIRLQTCRHTKIQGELGLHCKPSSCRGALQLQNPRTPKAKGCLHHVLCFTELKHFPVTIHVSNRWQSCLNGDKQLLLTIRSYDGAIGWLGDITVVVSFLSKFARERVGLLRRFTSCCQGKG